MATTNTHVLQISVNDINPDNDATYPDTFKLVKEFLQKPLSKEDLQNTLQAYVVDGKNLKVIQLLIDAGADVNYTYTGANKLLFMAHKNGNPEVVNLLLQNGASFTLKEKEYFKAIDPKFASSTAFLKAADAALEHSISSKPAAI